MSEPGYVHSPFNPTPAAPSAGGGRGCSKPLFIGCGALLVLLGICAIVFVVKAPALFEWWLRVVEQKVMTVVPDDVTPDERAALQKGFADLGGVFRHGGQPDAHYLQPFQSKLMQIVGKPKGQVTRQEILDLTRILEQTAGKKPVPAPEGAPPEPSPPSTPSPSAPPLPRT